MAGYSYFNGKQQVAGAAATLHQIYTIDGGLENHYLNVYNAITNHINDVNANSVKNSLKLVK